MAAGRRGTADHPGTEAAPLPRIATDAATPWLVDGYNVLHVTLLGGEDRRDWWQAPARRRLIERAQALPAQHGRVWLVFDGPDPVDEPEAGAPGPRIVFTPSADDWIVARARQLGPEACVVVTADRRLAGRARHAGATIMSPGDFVAHCRAEPTDDPT
jgi:predicted RNA-binding protein with PIN domain